MGLAEFSRDGNQVVLGKPDHKAGVYKVVTGKEIVTLSGRGTNLLAAEFSPFRSSSCFWYNTEEHLGSKQTIAIAKNASFCLSLSNTLQIKHAISQ